jgi:hypothetical protein
MFEINVASTTVNVDHRIACVMTAPGRRSRDGFTRKTRYAATGIAATAAAEIHVVRRGALGTRAARPRSTAFMMSRTSWSGRQDRGIVTAIPA